MPTRADHLLFDIIHLTLVFAVLGLAAYALIRRGNPLIRWHEHGNVWTGPFKPIDLVIAAMVFGIYYVLMWIPKFGPDMADSKPPQLEEMSTLSVALSVAAMVVSFGGLIAALLFGLAFARRVNISELFGLKRLPPAKILAWSVGMLAAALPVVILASLGWNHLLTHALGEPPPAQELVESFLGDTNLATKLLIAASACLIAPIAEEVMFRGLLYPAVKRFSERFFAAVLVSLLFAVVHGNLASVVPLAVLAMAFTIAYELTGCLLVPVVMHAIFNATSLILMVISMQFSNA